MHGHGVDRRVDVLYCEVSARAHVAVVYPPARVGVVVDPLDPLARLEGTYDGGVVAPQRVVGHDGLVGPRGACGGVPRQASLRP